jgi:hypothetical protein
MAFQNELAAALDRLPGDALERIPAAAAKSDVAGERALAEELSDTLYILNDAMREAAISERLGEPIRDHFCSHLEAKLPCRLNMSDVVRTRLTLRLLRAWLADQKVKATEELGLEAARKRIAERRERIKLGPAAGRAAGAPCDHCRDTAWSAWRRYAVRIQSGGLSQAEGSGPRHTG